MARPRSPDQHRMRGFAAGVNNVAPEQDLPLDDAGNQTSLRAAVNVDFVGPRKTVRTRRGYTLKTSGRFHSPARLPSALFAVRDGTLVRLDGTLTVAETLRTGLGQRRLSYAEVNGDLYWSNGVDFRRVAGADYADEPGWIECPGVPDADAVAGYALDAGTYRVAMTWFDRHGRESGADGYAEVDVAAQGGILVSNIPAPPEGAVSARLYASTANGDVLYAVTDLLLNVSQTVIGSTGTQAKALETLWRRPLPPCSILRFWNGRLLGASGNLLVWSDALRFGLATNDNYMRFGAYISMLEPIGNGENSAGCFIADHKNTYWMAGGSPKDWKRAVRYDYPAVQGTSLVVKGVDVGLDTTEDVVFWLAQNGVFCAGLPGGEVRPLTEGRLAIPGGDAGAAMFREFDGLRQLVVSYLSSASNGLAIGDTASATVTRYN